MTEDTQIIKKIQQGETEEFGRLYDSYIEKIYKFVYYKTHHKETAEDIVSLVFIKAQKKIQNFDLSTGTFQSWLYTIARNTVIDHYKTKKHDSNIEDAWDLSSDENIELDTDMKMSLEKLETYISKLKSDQRDILIMRLWQGLSYKEIAEALGKSEASCKMTFSRSIKKLREEMPADLFVVMLLFPHLFV